MLTRSLCPTCYKEIPADVAVGERVYMIKWCSEHGEFASLVEKDPRWFLFCQKLRCSKFYDGIIIDVTSRCNIRCKYCFHERGFDRAADDVVAEARQHVDRVPFILSGGEPTMHPQLPEIIRQVKEIGPLMILTNGVRLSDPSYLDELSAAGLADGRQLSIGLSFHPEAGGKDFELLRLMRERGLVAVTSFWVIDSLDQIGAALEAMREWRDVLGSMRIKAASNLWREQGVERKIFVSDMLNYTGATEPSMNLVTGADVNNKVNYANVEIDGMKIMFVSWYDRHNVDLNDIDCPVWYTAKDGRTLNLVTAALVNEGLEAQPCR